MSHSLRDGRAAFDSASGEAHASALSAAAEDSRLPREAILDRLSGSFGGLSANSSGPSGFVATTAQEPTTSPATAPTPYTMWARGFGSFGHIGGDGDAASLNRSLGGFVGGVDLDPDAQTRIGVAAGYTQSTMTVDARSSLGAINTAFGGLYGATGFGPLTLRGGALFAADEFATTRIVALPGFGDTDIATYGGDTLQAFGEAGWRFNFARATIEPFAGALALRVDTNAFNESGGASALSGQAGSYEENATTLGVRYETTPFGDLPLTARGMLGWQHAYGSLTPQEILAFESGPTTPFTIGGAPIARDSLVSETGLDWRLSQQATIGVFYSGELARKTSDNALEGKFEAQF